MFDAVQVEELEIIQKDKLMEKEIEEFIVK